MFVGSIFLMDKMRNISIRFEFLYIRQYNSTTPMLCSFVPDEYSSSIISSVVVVVIRVLEIVVGISIYRYIHQDRIARRHHNRVILISSSSKKGQYFNQHNAALTTYLT